MQPNIFLINLDRSPDRLAFMQEQFRTIGLTVERVSGVNGTAVPEYLAEDFRGPSLLTPGEVGCYASHLVIAKVIVERELPYGIILEDDVLLEPCFENVCRAAIERAPDGWGYLLLSHTFKHTLVGAARIDADHDLVRFRHCYLNTGATIVSYHGAKRWIVSRKRTRPVDIDVIKYPWNCGLDVLGVHPAIARQTETIVSTIDHGPREDTRSWSSDPFSPVYREMRAIRTLGIAARASDVVNSARRKFDGRRRTTLLRCFARKDQSIDRRAVSDEIG